MVTTSEGDGREPAAEIVLPLVQGGDGEHCPKCGEDIGVWSIVQAGLPNLIRCPHCRSRIRYEGAAGVFVFLLVVAIVFGCVAYMVAGMIIPGNPGLKVAAFAALLVAAWMPVEFAAARFLRRRRRLRAVG